MTHYHAMNGERGCLPDNNMFCETFEAAVDSLADLFELGRRRKAELKRNWYLELDPRRDGAAYCEITECQEEDCQAGDYD